LKELKFLSALNVAGIEKITLLENVFKLGSISEAAKAMGISYRTAWESIQLMNATSYGPLILTNSGGKKGGGALLTPNAKKILAKYQTVANEHKEFIQRINNTTNDLNELEEFLRRTAMRTSARNQFFGIVQKVKKGAINSEVQLELNGGDTLVATITNESVQALKIKKKSEAWAIFKASWVIIGLDDKIKLSARNQLSGSVSDIKKGAVNSEVSLKLKGGNEVTAVITNESLKELKLKKGTKATAYIKASHIILGVNS
jgi:molybdate transport system regulatory protein